LREARTFTGTAAELVHHLVAIDTDLEGRLSAKRLGKRLCALCRTSKDSGACSEGIDRNSKVTVFSLQGASTDESGSADLAEPQPAPMTEEIV